MGRLILNGRETKELWQTNCKTMEQLILDWVEGEGMEWERLLKIFLFLQENLGLSDNNISLIFRFSV